MNVYLLPISVAQQKYLHLNILCFINFFQLYNRSLLMNSLNLDLHDTGNLNNNFVHNITLCMLLVFQTYLCIVAVTVLAWSFLVASQTTEAPTFEPLKRSDELRAKALLKWLINNRTENNTKTFNAGFIRLSFHDCVGGCDGCLNLNNPSNAGMFIIFLKFIWPSNFMIKSVF